MDQRGYTAIDKDYIVIGAGPSGLQLGYFFERDKKDYLILEKGKQAGTFFKKFPRHGTLISINKHQTGYDDPEINLRWDWNTLLCDDPTFKFSNYTKKYFPKSKYMVQYLNDFQEKYNLNTQYNTDIVNIKKENEKFILIDSKNNTYTCNKLIIAAGFTKPYIPNIEGIELTENYADVSINPKDFTNKRVLILGKGNSAFETADNLIDTTALIHVASPNPVRFAWKTHFVGHLRAVNNNFLDTYQLKSQNGILNTIIEKIEKKSGKYLVTFSYTHANEEREVIEYDRIIACTGFRFDTSIFTPSIVPQLTDCGKLPLQTSEWESTNIKDLYFAGILTQMRDYKKTTSAFVHGFRYNTKLLNTILNIKYHNQSYPSQELSWDIDTITFAILGQLNQTSALWQQFGFIVGCIVLDKDNQPKYYKEVSNDYIKDANLNNNHPYLKISLEYGKHSVDPFNPEERVHKQDAENADQSTFLHPIVRFYSRDHQLLSTHHILEDLFAEWNEEEHIDPLLNFVNMILSNFFDYLNAKQGARVIRKRTKTNTRSKILV